MNKRFILIVIAIIIGVAGFLIWTQPSEEASSGTPSEHQYSQGSSGIVLMEYGDFQCPACGAYFPIVRQIKDAYKDVLTFQFRHLPLETIHLNARAAARAAEAAALQGKFWEMHDLLFENQYAWSDTKDPLGVFSSYAQRLDLDVEKFKTDYVSSTINAIINADIAAFDKTGQPKSTPTFFLDGKPISPDGTYEGFVKLLNDALQEKGVTPPETAAETQPAEGDTNPNELRSTEE